MILLFFESPSLLPWSVARAKVDKKPGLKACSGALSLATGNTNDLIKTYAVNMIGKRFTVYTHTHTHARADIKHISIKISSTRVLLYNI